MNLAATAMEKQSLHVNLNCMTVIVPHRAAKKKKKKIKITLSIITKNNKTNLMESTP